MKYGIIGDIHSNLEAFERVLQVLRERNVEEYICLGDIVGYGADPSACIRMARENCKVIVAGNHDHAVCELTDIEYFNPDAGNAVLWTKEKLTEDEQTFLAELNLTGQRGDFLAVHATPFMPQEWNYINSTFDAFRNFRAFDEKLCFVGHSHIPVVFRLSAEDKLCDHSFDLKLPILDECRYIINVGSVGQPRDGNPRACFATYDTSAHEVEILRVEYDIRKAQEKILQAGLPGSLASRLEAGV